MSKMNQLSIDEQETLYAEYLESLNQDLRKEGAEELRKDILRELNTMYKKAWTRPERVAYGVAIMLVERASI